MSPSRSVAVVSTLTLLLACASSQPAGVLPTRAPQSSAAIVPASPEEPASEPEAASESEPKRAPQCDLVCEGAHVVSHEIKPDESADYYTQEAVEHADRILGAMHDDLLTCYTARLRGNPKAHGFITVDIVIGPSGSVQNVETLGGALLGDAAMACIVNRIKRERFDPPHGGGTMRLEVPFSLRRVAPDEPI